MYIKNIYSNYITKKTVREDREIILALKTFKKIDLDNEIKGDSSLRLITCIILYGYEVWGFYISGELWRNIKQIQNLFWRYNVNMKGNTKSNLPYKK